MVAPQSLATLRFEQERRQFLLALAVAAAVVLTFTISDLALQALDPERVASIMTLRLVVLAIVTVIVLRLHREQDPARFRRGVIAVAWIMVSFALAAHFLRRTTPITPLFFELLGILAFFMAVPSLWRALVPALVTFAAGRFLLLVFRDTGLASAEALAIGSALLVATTMGILIGRGREAAARREDGLVAGEQEARAALERTIAELRVLRGILPICSHCRKVRDEVGAWADLESYVRRHSDTDFSHGLCPQCAHQHYPDLFGDPNGPAPEQPPG